MYFIWGKGKQWSGHFLQFPLNWQAAVWKQFNKKEQEKYRVATRTQRTPSPKKGQKTLKNVIFGQYKQVYKNSNSIFSFTGINWYTCGECVPLPLKV